MWGRSLEFTLRDIKQKSEIGNRHFLPFRPSRCTWSCSETFVWRSICSVLLGLRCPLCRNSITRVLRVIDSGGQWRCVRPFNWAIVDLVYPRSYWGHKLYRSLHIEIYAEITWVDLVRVDHIHTRLSNWLWWHWTCNSLGVTEWHSPILVRGLWLSDPEHL